MHLQMYLIISKSSDKIKHKCIIYMEVMNAEELTANLQKNKSFLLFVHYLRTFLVNFCLKQNRYFSKIGLS